MVEDVRHLGTASDAQTRDFVVSGVLVMFRRSVDTVLGRAVVAKQGMQDHDR